MKKILMPTLVPFWRRSTGAEERMFCLVSALKKHGHHVQTFFPLVPIQDDEQLWQRYELDVTNRTSDQTPQQFLNRARWYGQAIANRFGQSKDETEREDSALPAVTLDDYRWPWAITAFGEAADAFEPDVILGQYITTAYLLEGLSAKQRRSIYCMIDTHDCLSERNRQFNERGHQHWLNINAEEEAQVLALFDTVIAIEPAEASKFKEMLPQTEVIVAGHLPLPVTPAAAVPKAKKGITLGYLGSANASNLDAITRFLEQAWPQVANLPGVELVIAGSICDSIDQWRSTMNADQVEKIRLLGRISNLAEFYTQVDMAINPVQFGTGLKIKSAEALAYGVPLLTTLNRDADLWATPVPHQTNAISPIVVCQTVAAIADEIERLFAAPDRLAKLTAAAQQHAQQQPGVDVYAALLEKLIEVRPRT